MSLSVALISLETTNKRLLSTWCLMKPKSYMRFPKNLISTRISVWMSVGGSVKIMVTHWFSIFNSKLRFSVNMSKNIEMYWYHLWIISKILLGKMNQNPSRARRPKRTWRKIEVPSVLSTKISNKNSNSKIKASSLKTGETTLKDLSICPQTRPQTTLPSLLSMAALPCLTGQDLTQHRHAKQK